MENSGSANWRRRLITVDLLVKVACFVKKVDNILNIKSSWRELVISRRSIALSPLIKFTRSFVVKTYNLEYSGNNVVQLKRERKNWLKTCNVKRSQGFSFCHLGFSSMTMVSTTPLKMAPKTSMIDVERYLKRKRFEIVANKFVTLLSQRLQEDLNGLICA